MLDRKASFDKREIIQDTLNVDIFTSDEPELNIHLSLPFNHNDFDPEAFEISIKPIEVEFDSSQYIEFIKKELSKLLEDYERFQNSARYHSKIANLHLELGNKEDAIKHAEIATHLSDDISYRNLLTNLYIDFSDYQNAEIKLLERHEDDIFYNLKLAYLEFLKKNITKARLHLIKAISIDPLDYSSRMFLGTLYLSTGQPDLALRNFRVAKSSRFHSSVLHSNIALAYWYLGNKKKSFRSSIIALHLNKANTTALSILSRSAETLTQNKIVIQKLEGTLNNNKNSIEIISELAKKHYDNNVLGNSKKDLVYSYNYLLKENRIRSSSKALNNLGIVSWCLDKTDLGINYLEASLNTAAQQGEDISIPAFNLVGCLISKKSYKAGLKVLSKIMHRIKDHQIIEKLKLQEVVCMEGIGEYKAALDSSITLFHVSKNLDIKTESLFKIIYHFSIIDPNKNLLYEYIDLASTFLSTNQNIDRKILDKLYNNISFAFISNDDLTLANKYINKIKNVKTDPYSIATLGMYHIRKNELSKGEQYYSKAFKLLNNINELNRFKLKFAFEKALYFFKREEYSKASRIIEKATKLQSPSTKWINEDIDTLLNAIKDKRTDR